MNAPLYRTRGEEETARTITVKDNPMDRYMDRRSWYSGGKKRPICTGNIDGKTKSVGHCLLIFLFCENLSRLCIFDAFGACVEMRRHVQ